MEAGHVLADRYELLDRIGEGASSTVWEAKDLSSNERVAVKVVSLDEAGWRAEVRDRFQQEARLLTLGRHANLVQVRDLGETEEGSLFLVLERLYGETLAERLARPPRPGWREAAGIGLQIARGLAALHVQGIIHRDLKPANVILHRCLREDAPEGPVAKIIDLGISKVRAASIDPALFATLTATGQILGTPQYMSYEQAVGDRDIDARTDVWALGVVLYEMLTGKRPFEGANVNAVLAAIRRGPPPHLNELAGVVPAPILAVIERCLTKERSVRYANGSELERALEAAIAEGERGDRAKQRVQVLTVASIALVGLGLAAALLVRQCGG
jgi:serine/threonine protein kinase